MYVGVALAQERGELHILSLEIVSPTLFCVLFAFVFGFLFSRSPIAFHATRRSTALRTRCCLNYRLSFHRAAGGGSCASR